MITHTPECFHQHAVASSWWKRWFAACRDCGARGEVSWYEDVVGDGGPRMQMGDYCESCLGNDKCPRCGLPGVTEIVSTDSDDWRSLTKEQVGPCSACGWMMNNQRCIAPYDPWNDICACVYDEPDN